MATARRFLLILLINALAILVPAGLFMQRAWNDIDTARTETRGIVPARSLLTAIRLMQQHRGLSAVLLGGKEDAAAPRSAKAGEVTQALAAYRDAVQAAGGARPACGACWSRHCRRGRRWRRASTSASWTARNRLPSTRP